MPFVRPLTKLAATPESTAEIPGLVDEALRVAMTPALRARRSSTSRSTTSSPRPRSPSGPALPDPARRPGAPTATRSTRADALLREAERPVIMAGTNLYWGHGEDGAARARRGAAASRCSSTASRAAACRPTTSSSSRARAATALKGADVALVDRRADGLPPRLRRSRSARRPRSSRSTAPSRCASTRARSRPSSTAASPATLDALRDAARGGGPRHARVGRAAARRRGRAPRGRGGRARPTSARRCTRCALYGELARGARPQRDRHRRRRRLRLLRRARHRLLRAGLLAGPGPVRLPRVRAGLRARREARASRAPGRAARSATARSASAAWSSTRSRATA